MLRIQTILHPTDFSAAADQALEVAHALARDHNAKLVLVTVTVPPAPPISAHFPELPYFTPIDSAGLLDQTYEHLTCHASRLVDLPVELQVVPGPPGAAIVALAQERQADLIVMGTHGRTGASRLLMGSVAEYVLRHAKCPVLTVKPDTGQHLSHDEPTSLAASRSVELTVAQHT